MCRPVQVCDAVHTPSTRRLVRRRIQIPTEERGYRLLMNAPYHEVERHGHAIGDLSVDCRSSRWKLVGLSKRAAWFDILRRLAEGPRVTVILNPSLRQMGGVRPGSKKSAR
jgi:hypothetical protein